ncbi:MAG: hypothetical protein PHD88_07205 [Firmicutes bacterium]|nr:hypothetical protein [Bacillota bacterium]MDD4694169.1 hypothetical protein [Bacillota bacterium]
MEVKKEFLVDESGSVLVEYGLALLVLSAWVVGLLFLCREGIFVWHLAKLSAVFLSCKK